MKSKPSITLDEHKENTVRATVQIPSRGGQGVLVGGGVIITAAHCIDWPRDLERAVGHRHLDGNHHIEEITSGARRMKVAPLAVELVSDIAALGSLDVDVFPDEWEAFEKFCRNTRAIPLDSTEREVFQPFPVHILAVTGWIAGHAQLNFPTAENIHVFADADVLHGSSGGPIIDEAGRLVGITSGFGFLGGETPRDPSSKRDGPASRPHLTLPLWLFRHIEDQKR